MNSCVLLTNLWSLHFYPLFHNLQLLIIPLSCTSPPGFIHLLPTHFIQRPPMYMHLVLFPSALHFFPNGSLNHLPYLTALVAFVILLISHSVVSTFTPSPSINPFSIYSCHANPPFSLLYQAWPVCYPSTASMPPNLSITHCPLHYPPRSPPYISYFPSPLFVQIQSFNLKH